MREPETGVTIEARIDLKFTVYGKIEEKLRRGEDVSELVEDLINDTIECCGIAGEDMRLKDFDYSLNY